MRAWSCSFCVCACVYGVLSYLDFVIVFCCLRQSHTGVLAAHHAGTHIAAVADEQALKAAQARAQTTSDALVSVFVFALFTRTS